MEAGQEFTKCHPEQEQRCKQHGPLGALHDVVGEAAVCREAAIAERDRATAEVGRLRETVRDLQAVREDLVLRLADLHQVHTETMARIEPTDEERRALAGGEDGLVRLAAVRAYFRRAIGVEV